jgi:hypothetical protein
VQVAPGRSNSQPRGDQPPAGDDQRRGALVDHRRVEDDRAIGPALVRADPLAHPGAADLLLPLDEDPHVDRQRSGARQRARLVEQGEEVPLVVRRAARPDAPVADLRLERSAPPLLERARALDVVVPVDEDRRRAGAGGRKLAERERGAARLDQRGAAAGVGDPLDHPLRGLAQGDGIAPARGDRRNAQPLE